MAIGDKAPAPLNLSQAKFLMPSPRMNLRRAASYHNDKNAFARSPLSATTSRFNFNHLLFASPPPSPSLPALVPRPRKSPTHPRPSRILRALVWITFCFLILYLATIITTTGNVTAGLPYLVTEPRFEMVGQDELPDFATPIVVADTSGQYRWTVSIPTDFEFPLTVEDYGDMCSKCREASARVREVRGKNPAPQQTSLGRESRGDKYFVDVPDAEKSGLLPGISRPQKPLGSIIGENYYSSVQKPICESSMTFVLETTDAGLGNTLMELWIFYGLSLKQGRAFFIDDSRWAYGKYTDMFQPPPVPDCRPPPRHQILPCPTQARHLLVSSATAKELWSDSLSRPYPQGNTYDKGMRDIYKLASEGYRALFDLNKEDAEYVSRRVKTLREQAKKDSREGTVTGMHIRHGDRHPLEYQYRSSYIPANVFTERARSLSRAGPTQGKNGEQQKPGSLLVVASDDPTVYDSEDMAGAARAQEQIRLAGKQDVQGEGHRNARVMRHFVDESFGWEGGFFGGMFWNLGLPSMSASHAATVENMRLPPSEETLRLRSYVGRAYLMDLAVLAGASDRVLCTVSAMGCRLLAVMMGWERAMEREGWVNVDGDYGWTALTW